MKIGFISTYFYPVLGGAESNCFYLARELAKKHEVHVFTSNDGSFPAEEVIENIQVHRCKTTFRKGYYAAFYPSLLKKVVQQELDILHVHSFGFLWHDVCVVLKKLFSPKTKLVITPHGPFMALKKYALWKIIIKKIVNVIEFVPNRIYNRIIQVNPYQKEWLPKYGFKKSKIIFLPNGVPANFLKKAKPLKNLKGHFVISYVGRVQKYKGLDQVIRVLPFLKEKRKDVLFVIAGDPEEM
ncbi:MAG: glycosyltransferase family 4 protein, partial [Candidatus Nanoarchaeia archaeon]